MTTNNLKTLKVTCQPEVVEFSDQLVAIRREFHQIPELGHEEHKTQRLVLDKLASFGIDAAPLAGTGVVALIRGAKPGKTLMLRADMDGLPIDEENDAPYRSRHAGRMHACGHDAHMAIALGIGRAVKNKGLQEGTLKLMFQPAEEGRGGARKMIEAGVLTDPPVDASLAFHVWTPEPLGRVIANDGPAAASVDGFEITITGKGTHAATPEDGVDPIVVAAQLITAAQTLVTRRIGPHDPSVLSITSVQGGAAFNVIPEKVTLLGTIRTFDQQVRATLCQGLEVLAQQLASSMGAEASIKSLVAHEPVLNAPEIARLARRAAKEVVGEARVQQTRPLMVGEDIALVQERVPGALVLLGCGRPEGQQTFAHHHPRFDIDERVLPLGVDIGVRFCEAFFAG